MKTRSRTVRMAALATGIVLSLSACVGQGTAPATDATEVDTVTDTVTEGAPQATPASGDATRLVLWHGMTGPDGPAVEEIINNFNSSQDEVFVESNVMPWDVLHQRLLAQLAAPDGPQLIAMSAADLGQYAAQGALAPMDDFWDTDTWMDTSVLPEAAREASTVDGVTYGVPLNVAPMMLYWNKDMFEAAGLDPETPPRTWDELAEMAKQLTVDENGDGVPEQFGLALADNNTVPIWQMLLWGNGGGVVSQDGTESLLGTPQTIEALQYWVNLVRDDHISPIGLSGADADNLFRTQRAAMQIVGPWQTTAYTDAGINFGLAAPPAGPAGSDTLLDVVNFTTNGRIDPTQADAARKFLAFWNSPESQVVWADGSGFPPNRTDIPASDLANPYSAVFGNPELLNNSQVYLGGVPNSNQITTEVFEPALQRALNSSGDISSIFTDADAQVRSLIGQN